MTTPECTRTLANGRKCRGLAGRNQAFCRHHRPQPAQPSTPRNRYTPLARWRAVGRDLPTMPLDEIPSFLYSLMESLTQPGRGPSARTTGRFFRLALARLGQVPFPYPMPELEPDVESQFEPKFESRFESRFEPEFESKFESRFEPRFEPGTAAPLPTSPYPGPGATRLSPAAAKAPSLADLQRAITGITGARRPGPIPAAPRTGQAR